MPASPSARPPALTALAAAAILLILGLPADAAAEARGMAASHRPGPGRLPDEIVPTRYDLKLRVDPGKERFEGEVAIALDVKTPVYTFNFHALDLDVTSVTVAAGGRAIPAIVSSAAGAGAEPDEGEKMATLPESLRAGPATATILFSGPFNKNLAGIYRARDEAGRWYAYTQFETADARRAFPCFDEPRFKTPFRIELTIPETMSAIATTLDESTTIRNGEKTIAFRETRPLPTYLIAFDVGELDIVEGPKSSTRIRGVAARGKGSMLATALATHAELVPVMEKYFDQPYPFDKLDAAAQTEFAAGAMENAALITYREELLLVDPNSISLGRQWRIDSTISHEIAHEWFGDFVTMPWWNDIWLNESFATWMASRAVDLWRPERRAREGLLVQRAGAFAADSVAGTRAVRQPVKNVADAESSFDALTYAKGASIISMIEQWLGEETFRTGIRRHLAAHAYGNATADDLFDALAGASGRDVGRMARTFLDRPGVPLVDVTLTCPRGAPPSVVLSQSLYRPLGGSAPEGLPPGGPWMIPVCLAYPAGGRVERSCVVLAEEKMTAPLPGAASCPEWIHPNAGEYGYYRWSLPRAAALKIGDAVSTPWTPGRTAGADDATRSLIALLDQSWAMVAGGKMEPGAFLTTLEAVARRGGRRELEQVARRIDRIAEIWDEAARTDGFRSLVRRALEPEAKRLSWDPAPGESDDDAILRPGLIETLGLHGRAPWVLAGADERTRRYLKDSRAVPAAMAPMALAISARLGSLDFETLRGLLKAARTPSERTNALAALENLPPGAPLGAALDLALTDAVRVQDLGGIVFGSLDRPETRDQGFEFIQNRFDDIVKRMPGGFAGAARLQRRIGEFCSPGKRDAAKAFFEGRKIRNGERFLVEGLENANQCIALRSYGLAGLTSYLEGAPDSAP